MTDQPQEDEGSAAAEEAGTVDEGEPGGEIDAAEPEPEPNIPADPDR